MESPSFATGVIRNKHLRALQEILDELMKRARMNPVLEEYFQAVRNVLDRENARRRREDHEHRSVHRLRFDCARLESVPEEQIDRLIEGVRDGDEYEDLSDPARAFLRRSLTVLEESVSSHDG